MSYIVRSISIHSILFNQEWNLHPWASVNIPSELEESLSLVGIIHPPLVQLNEKEDNYSIIHGFRRLKWVQSRTDIDNIDCIVIPQNTHSEAILDVILADHLTGANLSLAEKARFIQIASTLVKTDIVSNKYMPLLQLKANTTSLANIFKLLEQEEEIIQEVHAGRLQEKMLSELFKLQNVEDRLALVKLFKKFGLGGGKQKRLFTLVRDIAYRQNQSITAFLDELVIQAILNNKEMNPPQKAQYLANFLQEQLTPQYNKTHDQFAKRLKKLQLPLSCSISHTQAFEKDDVTLSISFSDIEELERSLTGIKNSL